MSDAADAATELIESRNAQALHNHNNQIQRGPVYTGYCLECGELTEHPRRWCDAACRDQWEKHRR